MEIKNLSEKREKALGYLMGRAQRTMAIRFQKCFDDAGLDITKEHWILLVNLWIKDGQNQQELANNVFKDKASITRTLSVMERKNLLVRVEDNQDRRNKRIYLTQKGKDLKEVTFPIIWNLHQEALEDIPEEDVETCSRVLTKIYENLALPKEKTVEGATLENKTIKENQ
ncbi:MAG: MarR family transcriptional regulator [Bacteroidota bacterium]